MNKEIRYQAPTDKESVKVLCDAMNSFGFSKQKDVDRFVQLMERKSMLTNLSKYLRNLTKTTKPQKINKVNNELT